MSNNRLEQEELKFKKMILEEFEKLGWEGVISNIDDVDVVLTAIRGAEARIMKEAD